MVEERLAPYYAHFDVVVLPRARDEEGNSVGPLRRHYRGERVLLSEEQATRLLKLGAVGEGPPPARPGGSSSPTAAESEEEALALPKAFGPGDEE